MSVIFIFIMSLASLYLILATSCWISGCWSLYQVFLPMFLLHLIAFSQNRKFFGSIAHDQMLKVWRSLSLFHDMTIPVRICNYCWMIIWLYVLHEVCMNMTIQWIKAIRYFIFGLMVGVVSCINIFLEREGNLFRLSRCTGCMGLHLPSWSIVLCITFMFMS